MQISVELIATKRCVTTQITALETFDHVLGDEIDHVSLMCISEHELMQIWDTK